MKRYLQILIVAVFVLCCSAAVSAQRATRISFYKNSTAATVSSSLRGYSDKKVFVIKVLKGQTLRTEHIKNYSSTHYVTVYIKNPAGKDVGDSDASCNSGREITPTEAGDYTITVVECKKADAWRGRFRLKVSVK